jgi:outer membrane protein assembly factor BamB
VHAGVVYIASTDSTFTALDIRTGKMLWNIQTDAALYSTPVIQDGIVYICSLNGTIYAVDAQSGYTRWRVHVPTTGAKIWSSPVVVAGVLIVGVASTLQEKPKIPGQVLAFDIHTGKLRWQIFVQADHAPGAGVWSSPAIDVAHQIVYVGTGDPDDGVLALHIQDGSTLWHWRSTLHDVSDTDVGSGPILYVDQQGRQHVAVGGKDGMLYSLDASNGHVLWKTHVGEHVFSSPAFADNTIYVVAVQGQQAISQALDAATGVIHWRHTIPTIVYSSPAIAGQYLFVAIGNGFGAGDGGVQVLNARTGQLLQYADLQSTISSSPAVLSSWLFVGSSNGNLNAFTRS